MEVPNESEMKKHMKKPHKKCDQCQFQTTKLTELRPHVENEHGGSVTCEACDFSGKDVKSLKKHMDEDHKCSKCRMPKGKKVVLDCKSCKMPTHMECLKIDIGKERAEKYKTNPSDFQCKSCVENLIGIGETSHILANEKYSCKYCPHTTNTEKDLREHVATHIPNMVNCEKCDEKFVTVEELTTHISMHHQIHTNIICDICERAFPSTEKLEEHMATHAGPSTFVCPICGYNAKKIEEIQVHMKDHDAESNTNIMKGLEESCRKLGEQIIIERKCNEKNVSVIKDLEDKVKALSTEVEESKEMIKNEIRKNEEKQEKIEELEEVIRTNKNNGSPNDKDTKEALERAKDVIIEYKSEVARLTKDKDIEVGKVMVEKMRVEEDLRIATLENKRLFDTERILLNTFDTLKKYYDTKEQGIRDTNEKRKTASEETFRCSKCEFETTTRTMLNKHITDVHEIKRYKCDKCDFEDKTEEKLNKHITNIHMNDEDMKCRKCSYEAKERNDLSKHIADVHDVDIRQNKNKTPGHFYRKRATFQAKEFCNYWNRGYCKFGDTCFKAHENTPYCYFQERCDRKNTCIFYHEDFLDTGREAGYYR